VISISVYGNSDLLASVGLTASNGVPIPGAKIHFSIPTDFGLLAVGSNVTQSNGTAYLYYHLPSQWGGLVYASYSGSKAYSPSNVTGAIEYVATTTSAGPPYVSGQSNFIDLRVVGVPALPTAIVMGIFLLVNFSFLGVIVYVVIHVLGIRKRSSKVEQ